MFSSVFIWRTLLSNIKTCKGFETPVGVGILFSKMPHILFSFFFPVPAERLWHNFHPCRKSLHIHWAKKSWGSYLVLTSRWLMEHKSNIMGCHLWPDFILGRGAATRPRRILMYVSLWMLLDALVGYVKFT